MLGVAVWNSETEPWRGFHLQNASPSSESSLLPSQCFLVISFPYHSPQMSMQEVSKYKAKFRLGTFFPWLFTRDATPVTHTPSSVTNLTTAKSQFALDLALPSQF